MPNLICCDPVCFRAGSLDLFIQSSGELDFRAVEVPWFMVKNEFETAVHLAIKHNLKIAVVQIEEAFLTDPNLISHAADLFQTISDLGAATVVGCAGETGSAAAYDQRISQIQRIGELAALHGLTLCLETRPGLCQDQHTMSRTILDVDHPNVRLSFDTAGLLYYNDNINGEIALAKVCHLVQHVRLSDSQGEYGKWHFPALGYGGAVDFLRVLDIMNGCGFEGPYCISLAGIAGEGELTIQQYRQRMRDSLETLHTCGYFC